MGILKHQRNEQELQGLAHSKKEIIPDPMLFDLDSPEFRQRLESGEFIRHKHVWEKIGPLLVFECENRGPIKIGDCRFYEPIRLRCNPGGYIELGNYSHFGHDVEIDSKKSVIIGPYCGIAPRCRIIDCSYHGVGNNPQKAAPIVLEGQNQLFPDVVVLMGVTIGRGTAVGCNSVVTNDLEPWSFYAGNPAKFIKKIEPFEGKHGENWEEKWWDPDFKPLPYNL